MVTVNDEGAKHYQSKEGTVTTAPDDPQLVPARPGAGSRAGSERRRRRPSPSAEQLFQRLLRHRIIFLGQQVDDDLANRICAELILLAAEDAKRDISLYINSPGGSVYAGLAIYDVMQYVPNDVATYAMGMAASMGQFLLAAGADGQALRDAARGDPDAPAARRHRRHGHRHPDPGRAQPVPQARAGRADAMHTGQTVEQIEVDSDRDRWFTADEAKDYGFVDQVVRSATEVPTGGPALVTLA